MPQQTFTVTADIPPGYEPTGEYRQPKAGEDFSINGRKYTQALSECYSQDYHILRKAWAPPACFPNGYWVYFYDGEWFLCKLAPLGPGRGVVSDLQFSPVKARLFAEVYGEKFDAPKSNVTQIQVNRG